jgi:putative membrane protein
MINWWHWHTEPELIGGILLVAWLYAVFTGPLRHRIAPHTAYPRSSAISFYSGLVLFYLTVGSPLDYVGEVYLFSAHMAQHILLMYPVPVLLILGMPDWLTRPVLENRIVGGIFRILTRPAVAGILFIGTLTAWHVPEFYEAALRSRLIHNLEHVTMFGTSFLVWWNIFSRSATIPALGYGAQILFIFVLSLGKIPVASYLVFAKEVLYPTYEFAPRITTLSAFDDQVLGGAMKTLVAKFIGMLLIGLSFYRWFQEHEKEEQAQEEHHPEEDLEPEKVDQAK